ncbi:hypothetical protein [Roseimicrobium sp. ORNL1]|uniref:hypothetical protein n=1 Tax=Roseimicrobium sp. ORNL1 TaxID=2711231 RepID=UPI0013E16299|nr:hypothetical protein [Roseimicrobium sp. ORNL1]QIF01497.1 hypothetical protein G5S37_08160 [Roseimicrobium sp. ORNL1]
MKSLRPLLCVALALACLPLLASCSSKDDESTISYNKRLREKNERYQERQDKRKMRARARQQRVDMWFDRLMH